MDPRFVFCWLSSHQNYFWKLISDPLSLKFRQRRERERERERERKNPFSRSNFGDKYFDIFDQKCDARAEDVGTQTEETRQDQTIPKLTTKLLILVKGVTLSCAHCWRRTFTNRYSRNYYSVKPLSFQTAQLGIHLMELLPEDEVYLLQGPDIGHKSDFMKESGNKGRSKACIRRDTNHKTT